MQLVRISLQTLDTAMQFPNIGFAIAGQNVMQLLSSVGCI